MAWRSPSSARAPAVRAAAYRAAWAGQIPVASAPAASNPASPSAAAAVALALVRPLSHDRAPRRPVVRSFICHLRQPAVLCGRPALMTPHGPGRLRDLADQVSDSALASAVPAGW
ncbi:MAG: hypothetical protein ACRDRJ_54215 [Streptosporangiaceae bacterium]